MITIVLETSLLRPITIFTIGYVINPMAIPFVMLKVSGMIAIIKYAGKPSVRSSNGISFILRTNSPPTIIKIGAMALIGMILSNGMIKSAGIKRIPVMNAVNPVLPPAAIPVEDSAAETVALEPNNEAPIIDKESA